MVQIIKVALGLVKCCKIVSVLAIEIVRTGRQKGIENAMLVGVLPILIRTTIEYLLGEGRRSQGLIYAIFET
jgi:uncharacterized membrane protein